MHKTCKKCDTVITGGEICLYCKSLQTDCKLNAKGYKEMSIGVPWCWEYDKRLLHLNWCEDCEHYRGG